MKFSDFEFKKIQNARATVGGTTYPTQSLQMTHYPWYRPSPSKGDTDKDTRTTK